MLYPVASPLEPKPKYWIHTTTVGHPPWTAIFSPFTAIKGYLNLDHSLHHTRPCLHFPSSLARAPHHWSFTHRRHSLSLSSHVHRSSTQRHLLWWSSDQPSFTSWTTYRHVNSHKRYFKILQHHVRLSTSFEWKTINRSVFSVYHLIFPVLIFSKFSEFLKKLNQIDRFLVNQ
jgi:hypothetical protein